MFDYLIGQGGVVESVNDLNEAIISFGDGSIMTFEESCIELIKTKKDSLSQPELQFLTKFLSDTLCGLQSDIKYYETCAANIWDKCNKEDEHAARLFKTLNHYKDHNKELKKKVKKLSEVQGKLKRQVGK